MAVLSQEYTYINFSRICKTTEYVTYVPEYQSTFSPYDPVSYTP